jgi:glutamate-1-semialdehyde 2,1-aminomutase
VASGVEVEDELRAAPLYASRTRGAFVWDLDGTRYLDFALGGGAVLAGHAHPVVTAAVVGQVERGTASWPPSGLAADLAGQLRRRWSAAEVATFTGSAAEANLHAVELARAATGRGGVLRVDPPGGGVAFNDLSGLERTLREAAGQVAAVVLEPVLTTAGIIPPGPGYLAGVRELADRHDALLVFDETRGGPRIGPGGAGGRYGVRPDLVTMGAGVAAGVPIGVVGGQPGLLAQAPAPSQASPLALAAALGSTEVLTDETWAGMERRAARLAEGLAELVEVYAIPVQVSQVGAAGSVLFARRPPAGRSDAAAGSDTTAWRRWWLAMLAHGVLPMPGAWHESWTVSAAHTDDDVERVLEAAEAALATVFGV